MNKSSKRQQPQNGTSTAATVDKPYLDQVLEDSATGDCENSGLFRTLILSGKTLMWSG